MLEQKTVLSFQVTRNGHQAGNRLRFLSLLCTLLSMFLLSRSLTIYLCRRLIYCINALLLSLVASQVNGASKAIRSVLDPSVLTEQWNTDHLQGQAALIKDLT